MNSPTDNFTAGRFATTQWTVVLNAASADSKQGKEALEILCRRYWFAIYAYLRRLQFNSQDAEDYTQAFFTALLTKRSLRRVQRQKGKFRTFLLVCLKHFMANQYKRINTKKRGGKCVVFSLDCALAENRYDLEPRNELTPEKIFERSWAITILDNTLRRLEQEQRSEKKQKLYNHLKENLTVKKNAVLYKELAGKLNMTEGSVKVALYRLRSRYRELLRDEIAQTVENQQQVDEEIRQLFKSLA